MRHSFGYYGPSIDAGVQLVLPFGLVFSGSLGLHYRFVGSGSIDTSGMPWGWAIADGPGLRPRMRVELGWAFL